MSLTLFIAQAIICSSAQCWPVLLGKDTSQFVDQEFSLKRRLTEDPGYGGEVLQFTETETTVYAIHQTWTLRPAENRESRLRSGKIRDRIVTRGCINVEPDVYKHLSTSFTTLRIRQ